MSCLANSGSRTVESEAQADSPMFLFFLLTASASSDKLGALESKCTTGNFSVAEVSCQVNGSQSDQLTSNSFYKMHQPHSLKPFMIPFLSFLPFFEVWAHRIAQSSASLTLLLVNKLALVLSVFIDSCQ